MLKRIGLALVAAALCGCATTPDFSVPSPTAWPELTKFQSEAEFEHYYLTITGHLEQDVEQSDDWWMDGSPPPPPSPVAEMSAPAEIVVTATRIDDTNPSITNTQEAGVDEGDIVKQIGQYLIVMQDGRLFSIDLLPGGEPGLHHVDRENVYQTTEEDTWYDEMLVYGRQMIVIGYSYDAEASVFAVLELEDDGQITFRDRFFLPAQDYFDGENYTTRLVDGQLALHTSFYLTEVRNFEDLNAPVLSRSMSDQDVPRLDARSVYRPVQDTPDPLLHTITMCPLRDLGLDEADAPECRTTAFLAGDSYEYYASTDAVWLWVNRDGYAWWLDDGDDSEETTALLYQIPYDCAPGLARVEGRPVNQFSLAAGEDVFRAFVEVDDSDDGASPYRLLQLPLSHVRVRPAEIDAADYTALPGVEGYPLENRFTGTHFVYTAKNDEVYLWDKDPDPVTATLAVVPLSDPSSPELVKLPHGVIRLERARDHIIATGYHDGRGLSLTSVDLRGDEARRAGTITLASRFESENRSHAFNSAIGADGSGLIGLPTVLKRWDAGRFVWRSDSSDISFLRVGSDASLSSVGVLNGADGEPHETYACEVSCVDWYGNSRPIFTMGRVFALSGTSLVEGEVGEQRVSELRRVDLTEPVKRKPEG